MTVQIHKLLELDKIKKRVFAYLTCERLYPNYVSFAIEYNFGFPKVLRHSIDFIYENIFREKIEQTLIVGQINRINKSCPNTEDFDTILASSALDACTCITDTLDFLNNSDSKLLQYISSYATDSVDMYIQYIENLDFNNDESFQKKIDTHRLMVNEVGIQNGIIDFLLKKNQIDMQDVQLLLDMQGRNRGNLDL